MSTHTSCYEPQFRSLGTQSAVSDEAKSVAPRRYTGTPRALPPPFDVVSVEAAAAVFPRWKVPCEAVFELLARAYPDDLALLICTGRLEPSDLTFAAEYLGQSKRSDLVRMALEPLLSHPDAVVREGAIYGIQRHLDERIRQRLAEIASRDPSPAVRRDAKDALEEL